ncbi:taurine-pyruvate aminotransferase [Pseudooceanicola antarcticus]|uniref:Aspartate aminotransferase family protein n=1 Tax=Pseudooceanicola antarcticus TaxID=1247613 RepID=A0A285IQW0_9RHOB|nr:aminotransferase class III-fold pyridoxal phosphate-dependent enzyme [Pseudooceanicola antarcticus]PJE31781.1 aspartate aminotransferase family protein [Pseudooceanicola antarcticus]SNY50378.1 taurine-pyruvate aminotransferase [Pseudooceanicola antarcticus]
MTLDLPANPNAAAVAADRAHVWHHLTQHKPFETRDPRVFVKGQGLRVWDAEGRQFLDGVSGGVWTVNVGYGRARIAQAVAHALTEMNFFAQTTGSVPGAQFAEKLISRMPGMSRVYYGNSGTEVNEKAWKMIRQIAVKRHGGRKSKILFRERDYHGASITALSACGQGQRVRDYGPFTPGFVEVPHCLEYRAQWGEGDHAGSYGERAADAIEEVILREGPDTIGALCLEPITAGGGVITPPMGYWERVQQICAKYDILLHLDEVVCGLGRTGTWFGYQHYGLKPDFVTMAKGVASGYAAVACLVTTEEVFDTFKDAPEDEMSHFRDISTYAGCTAGPAAALENMAIIEEENLLENTRNMGDRLMDNLRALQENHAAIGDVRGKGLFCGAELVADRSTRAPLAEAQVQRVLAECQARGVLIGSTARAMQGLNNTLCLAPSLCVSADEIDEITSTLDQALTRVLG